MTIRSISTREPLPAAAVPASQSPLEPSPAARSARADASAFESADRSVVADALRTSPAGNLALSTAHEPIGPFPPGVPINRGHVGERIEKSATPEAAIPDQGAVSSTLEFDQDFTVEDLRVDLDIGHSYRGDLVVTLTSPSGKSAVISNREGGSADDLQGGFDLSAFGNEPLKGKWTLTVEDKARLDTGTLRSWKLSVVGRSVAQPATSVTMPVLGQGEIKDRYTAEVAGKNGFVYTTTWGNRTKSGNTVNVWDTRSGKPELASTLTIPGAGTLGDVSISDDGKTMMVATNKGSIVTYDLADPAHPKQLSEFSSADTKPEVHTAKLATVNGKLYGFLSSIFSSPPKVVIVDLSNPAAPKQVKALSNGDPYQHDVWVKDGLLYSAGWDEGMSIYDIGGGGRGGAPENPVKISTVPTKGGAVHNIATYDDPISHKKFALIGEEHPGSIGKSSAGDIHVVDVTDPTQPKEVAYYHVDGAGTHNFALDPEKGILYAAYYNAGVRALDIRGDLSQGVKGPDGRVDLGKSGREVGHALGEKPGDNFVWGVQLLDGALYASDMLNGVFKLDPSVIHLPDHPPEPPSAN